MLEPQFRIHFRHMPLSIANSDSYKIDIPFEEKDKATIINMANKVTGLSKKTANTLASHCFVFPISISSEYTSKGIWYCVVCLR